MKQYALEASDAADADIEAAFRWYQSQQPELGLEFLNELRTAYHRIAGGPLTYQEVALGIRRGLTRRFPFAIYFAIKDESIFVVAVLHTARDPAEWQWRL